MRLTRANVMTLVEQHGVKRDKKNTALSKHKKWLHDLQKERARLQEALADDEADKQQKKERCVPPVAARVTRLASSLINRLVVRT